MAMRTGTGSGALFRRVRLFNEIEANRCVACTWIAGPVGSGKTALLSSFVGERTLPWLWCQIDADDADPSVFFARLTAAARATLGTAAQGLPHFTPDAAFSLSSFSRHYFRELFASAPALMIVLDDYHQVALTCPLHDVVLAAIEQAPNGAHIAVASRARPTPTLARCQTNGTVRVISWDRLMLSVDEVVGFAAMHGLTLDERAARTWLDRCGGWAAGLRLLLGSGAAASAQVTHGADRALLFDYLGQEVYRNLPQALQSQLLHLAFLPRIPAALVTELVGSPSAEHGLAALAEDNLFTSLTLAEDGLRTYRLHPLLRGFLIDLAETELPEREVLARRHRAATVLMSCGMIEEAAEVWGDAKAWDELARLVQAHAANLMLQGQQATLENWLSRFPPERVAGDPWLLYWLGASRALHDPFSGRRSLEAAFDLFSRRPDRGGLLLAWSGVVDCIFRIYSNLRQLDVWIERLDGLLAADASYPSPDVEARVTFSMFVALSFRQPQHPGLALWRQRLDVLAGVVPDPMFRIFSRFHLTVGRIWQGDLQAAEAELWKLELETARVSMSPLVELVGLVAESTYSLYVGQVARGLDAIDKALAIAESSGIHLWDKILLGQGAALALSHGDAARGKTYARQRAAVAKLADDEEQGLHHVIEAWSCWLSGHCVEALAHVRLGAGFNERMGLPHFNAVGGLSLAIVSFDCGEQDAALRQLDKARALGALAGNPMIGWMADLLEAYMRLRRGEDAADLVASCMSAGKAHGFRHFFFWPRRAVAIVCREALALGVQIDYATDLIEKGNLDPPPDAAESDHWPRPVKVYTLGRFLILVRGEPVLFEGKAQRAPLALLKVIIAFGGVDVAESRAIDALWPDAEGGAGEQALATTLSRLRKLVGTGSIKRQAGILGLDANQCWVDCWALGRLMLPEAADKPRVLCEKLRQLYRGEFLHGESDAPWALQLRERIHVGLIKVLCRNGEAALNNREPDLAAMFYELGLSVDDLVEAFYGGLIRCHTQNGQASLAVKTYHRCQAVLSKRLGVAPSEGTTRLYLAAIDGKTA